MRKITFIVFFVIFVLFFLWLYEEEVKSIPVVSRLRNTFVEIQGAYKEIFRGMTPILEMLSKDKKVPEKFTLESLEDLEKAVKLIEGINKEGQRRTPYLLKK